MSKLKNIFPFLDWIWELKDFRVLRSDIIAWLTVAFVLVPQSMAYAQLAWLPIEVGLYTAFIPVIVAGLFGSSRQMSSWPVTIISLMSATALAPIASQNTDSYIVYASLLAFFIGLFYLLLWFLKLWIIVDFLSHPVVNWFTNGVAIITIISQIWKIFWVSLEKWTNIFSSLYNLFFLIIENIHIPTFVFGSLVIFVLLFLKYFFPKIPRVLIVIILSTFISYKIWFQENFDWKIVKNIWDSLPSFSLPFLSSYVLDWLSIPQIIDLMIFSVIIALIWFTESISVAKFVSRKTNHKVSANRELIWQWLANISSWVFGWYWVAWSFSKTAVNLRAWAITPFSSLVTGLFVLVTILFLSKYLYYLPQVCLAAVIIVAVSSLIKIKPIIKSWKTDRHDSIVAITTFSLTLILSPNIELAIIVWVLISLSFFISRSMRPRIVEVSMYKDGLYRDVELFWLKSSKHISAIRFDGVLYFANAPYFEEKVMEIVSQKSKLKYVILDLEWMADIDSTWVESMFSLFSRLDDMWIKVLLTSLRVKIISKFKEYSLLDYVWKKHIFVHIEKALDYIYEKKWDDIDLEPLEEYVSNKDWKKELWRYLIKKYVNK